MNDLVPAPLLESAALADVAPTMPTLLNRERAILEFNRRVLAQARRTDVPLLERLRYVCIVSSNLDEFFEVRFADFLEAYRQPGAGVSRLDLQSVAAEAHGLIDDQYAVFNDEVMPALQRAGILILNHADRDEAQRRWVDAFFQRQVRPLLVPVGLDPSQAPANVPQHHPSRYVGSRVAIDATRKHEYPAISLPPKEHLDLVASRWKEYGIED